MDRLLKEKIMNYLRLKEWPYITEDGMLEYSLDDDGKLVVTSIEKYYERI